MADTWSCLQCGKEIGMWDTRCKHCGASQFGENNEFYPTENASQQAKTLLNNAALNPPKKRRKSLTVEEQFAFGIHPNDETYRKTLELEILGKNYKK